VRSFSDRSARMAMVFMFRMSVQICPWDRSCSSMMRGSRIGYRRSAPLEGSPCWQGMWSRCGRGLRVRWRQSAIPRGSVCGLDQRRWHQAAPSDRPGLGLLIRGLWVRSPGGPPGGRQSPLRAARPAAMASRGPDRVPGPPVWLPACKVIALRLARSARPGGSSASDSSTSGSRLHRLHGGIDAGQSPG